MDETSSRNTGYMVKVSATTDSICLEYIKDGNTMPYSAWKDDSEASIYADITPFVDFSDLRNVMIITNFDGKGGIEPSGDK